MVKYRKNERFGFLSGSCDDTKTDVLMQSMIEQIQEDNPNKDIDIVDISIRTVLDTEYSKMLHYITVFYAIEESKSNEI